MFGPKKSITIKIKFFGGLDVEAGIETYDPDVGVELRIADKVRLGKVVKPAGLSKIDSIALFVNGNPAGPRERLNEGDVVFCMRPMAGG